MSRLTERARVFRVLSVVLASCVLLSLSGCEELDARVRNGKGNRLFRETQFIDAAAQYERALKTLDDPIIHYNLGLAYAKIFKPGYQAPVLLGTKDEFVCQEIPGVRMVEAGACVKPGDRHYAECGSSKAAPIEKAIADLDSQMKAATDEVKKKELEMELKEKQDELARFTCASSFQCLETTYCALTSPEIADLAAQHFQAWLKVQPSDDEIKELLVDANKRLEAAKEANNQSEISSTGKEVEELSTKDVTRKMMSRLWMDSEQHRKALDYWEGLLREKPNDTEIIGTLAGVTLSAGDWRKSIEWYIKQADLMSDPSSKLVPFNFIGNVAWSRLNMKTLVGADAVELADRGIGALQRAIEIQPKNPKFYSLQASLFNFRSTAHGASWAAAIDRATAQDLSKLTRVLLEEAKKAQGQPPTPPAGSGSAAPAAGSTPAGGASSPAPASPTPQGAAAPTPEPAQPAPSQQNPPETAPPAPATGGTVEKSGG